MTSFRYTAAISLIFAQLGAQPLHAASKIVPIGDQLLRAGQLFSLVIKTTDPATHDETVINELSVDAQTLPDNAVLLDNLDGSRTFMWIPDDHDSGDHALIIHLKNIATSETMHQQSITLTIASSDEEYQRLMQERQAPVQLPVEVAPPPDMFPSTVQHSKSISHAPVTALIVEPQAEPNSLEQVITPAQGDGEISQKKELEPESSQIDPGLALDVEQTSHDVKIPSTIAGLKPVAIVEVATDKEPETVVIADSTEAENNTVDIVVEPSIVMADTLSLTVGDRFEQDIKLEPATSARHTLRLLNRPDGLTLIKFLDSVYALSWLPDLPDAGSSIVILQLIDVESGAILDSQRIKLLVRQP